VVEGCLPGPGGGSFPFVWGAPLARGAWCPGPQWRQWSRPGLPAPVARRPERGLDGGLSLPGVPVPGGAGTSVGVLLRPGQLSAVPIAGFHWRARCC